MPPPSPWERAAPSGPTDVETPGWATLVLTGAARGWMIFAIVWGSILFVGQSVAQSLSRHHTHTSAQQVNTVVSDYNATDTAIQSAITRFHSSRHRRLSPRLARPCRVDAHPVRQRSRGMSLPSNAGQGAQVVESDTTQLASILARVGELLGPLDVPVHGPQQQHQHDPDVVSGRHAESRRHHEDRPRLSTVSDRVVEVEQQGHTRILRITRPAAMNTLSSAVLLELVDTVHALRSDPDVRCFVIAGAPRADGTPCFSAGVDLKEAAAGAMAPGNPGRRLTEMIDECPIPSIAVIDGVCTTGALELALACDLRIVADTAQISDWHLARLGAGLGAWGASTRLARLVGVAQAKDLILTGKVINGREALRIGLAQRLAPSAALWQEAMGVAEAVAAMRPQGVRVTLAHLDKVQDLSKEESLSFARQLTEWRSGGTSFEESAQGILQHRDEPPGR